MFENLQQAAHQPAKNFPCHLCECAYGTKASSFDKKSMTK
jgi:hypothetical protein